MIFIFIKGFQNVSEVLAEKTTTIGGAKDLAMDLQKRANDLAGLASNKLSFLSGKLCSQFSSDSKFLLTLYYQITNQIVLTKNTIENS